jgi:hypothetical protein
MRLQRATSGEAPGGEPTVNHLQAEPRRAPLNRCSRPNRKAAIEHAPEDLFPLGDPRLRALTDRWVRGLLRCMQGPAQLAKRIPRVRFKFPVVHGGLQNLGAGVEPAPGRFEADCSATELPQGTRSYVSGSSPARAMNRRSCSASATERPCSANPSQGRDLLRFP